MASVSPLRRGAALLRAPADLSTESGRGRDRQRRVALTALASAAAKAITIVASLVTVPLTLHYLGAERYGIWMVVSSFTMVLAFADLGLGNGLVNEVAAAHGRDDRAAIRRIVSSGYAALAGIGAVLLLAFALAYPFVAWQRLFNATSPLAVAEAGPTLAVWVVCFALGVPMALVGKVQAALQQGFYASLWQCAGSLAGVAALLAAIGAGAGLPVLVSALVGGPLLGAAANTAWFFARGGRDIAPTPAQVSRSAIRAIALLGLKFFVLQALGAVIFGLDATIIAQVAGAGAVASYAVPERMFAIVSMLLAMLLQPLWPAYGEAVARGHHAWVRRTLIRSLLFAGGISLLVTGTLVVAGPTLLRFWVGDAVRAPLVLLVGLAAWKVAEALGTTLAAFLNGVGALGVQIAVALVSGVAMLTAKIVLVRAIGVAGIPWGGAIPYLLLTVVPCLVFVRQRLATPSPLCQAEAGSFKRGRTVEP